MISFAAHLKRQSPSMSYGNGWIMGENGRPWHPCKSQRELLNSITTKRAGYSQRLRRIFGG
ncbi:phage filamentation protein Fil family protein [Pantoea vagans]|uniref:phage filamentation protein Fil family protein n=1 Tax=Pantoea vagans TaxID=470934 RepID=UPI00320B7AB0